MSTRDTITNKLREAFAPESLDVTDESHLHEGHAGHRPGGETHFRVYIVSPAFEGKSRIERHRMINAALAAELAGSVHALAIKAQAPGEAGGTGISPSQADSGNSSACARYYLALPWRTRTQNDVPARFGFFSSTSASRGTGTIRSAVMRLRSRRSTRKRKPWKVKLWPRSGIERAS